MPISPDLIDYARDLELLRLVSPYAYSELAEYGGVEPRVGQFEPEQILPVDAGADGLHLAYNSRSGLAPEFPIAPYCPAPL